MVSRVSWLKRRGNDSRESLLPVVDPSARHSSFKTMGKGTGYLRSINDRDLPVGANPSVGKLPPPSAPAQLQPHEQATSPDGFNNVLFGGRADINAAETVNMQSSICESPTLLGRQLASPPLVSDRDEAIGSAFTGYESALTVAEVAMEECSETTK